MNIYIYISREFQKFHSTISQQGSETPRKTRRTENATSKEARDWDPSLGTLKIARAEAWREARGVTTKGILRLCQSETGAGGMLSPLSIPPLECRQHSITPKTHLSPRTPQ